MALPTLFLTIAKIFNFSHSRGLTDACAFISYKSRDTTSSAMNTQNIVPRQINLHFPNHAHTHTLTCTALISIGDHSPWVVQSTASGGGTRAAAAEVATGGNSDSKQRQQAALATAQTTGSGHQAAGANPDSKQRQQQQQAAAPATGSGDDRPGAAKTALESAATGTILLDVTKTLSILNTIYLNTHSSKLYSLTV